MSHRALAWSLSALGVLVGCGGGSAADDDEAPSNLEQRAPSTATLLSKKETSAFAVDGDVVYYGSAFRDGPGQIVAQKIDGTGTPSVLWSSPARQSQLAAVRGIVVDGADLVVLGEDRDYGARLWRMPKSGGEPRELARKTFASWSWKMVHDREGKRVLVSGGNTVLVLSLEDNAVSEVAHGGACHTIVLHENGALCFPQHNLNREYFYADLRAPNPAFARVGVPGGHQLVANHVSLHQGRAYAHVDDPTRRTPADPLTSEKLITFDAKSGELLHVGSSAIVRPVREHGVDAVQAHDGGKVCMATGSLYCRRDEASDFVAVAKVDLAYDTVRQITFSGDRVVTASSYGIAVAEFRAR